MKKILITMVSLVILIGLTACSNNNNKFVTKQPDEDELNFKNDEMEDEEPEDIDENELPEVGESTEGNGDQEDEVDQSEESKGKDIPNEMMEFEESIVVTDQIGIDQLTTNVQTDNQNNRVIIFSDQEKKKRYKSIFIKRQNRLKIINLDDDVQVFNEVIG